MNGRQSPVTGSGALMHRLQVRNALALSVLLPQAACGAGWHRIDTVTPATLARGEQVQVWQGGRKIQLHAVRVEQDSISGVPFEKPAGCDGCRISLPSSSVDSVRTGDPTSAFLKNIALTVGGWLSLGLVSYFLGKD
jgi:hypothetical protein